MHDDILSLIRAHPDNSCYLLFIIERITGVRWQLRIKFISNVESHIGVQGDGGGGLTLEIKFGEQKRWIITSS